VWILSNFFRGMWSGFGVLWSCKDCSNTLRVRLLVSCNVVCELAPLRLILSTLLLPVDAVNRRISGANVGRSQFVSSCSVIDWRQRNVQLGEVHLQWAVLLSDAYAVHTHSTVCDVNVHLSVCLSVCLSHSCIVLRQLNLSAASLCCVISWQSSFLALKTLMHFQ